MADLNFLCVYVQFRMKECGVAEIVKTDTVVSTPQPSHSSSSAPDISSVVKSPTQNGMARAWALSVFSPFQVYIGNLAIWSILNCEEQGQ